jgi:hypothetical protein
MKTPVRTLRRSLLLPALLLGLSMPALAQDAAATPAQTITPEARAVIDRMNAYMKGLQAYTIQAHGTRDEVIANGYKLQNNEAAALAVQRPNKMRAEVRGDVRDRDFVYDGKTITIHSPDDNAYATAPATESLGVLLDGLLSADVELPLIDVLYQATAGTLTENVRSGLLVGDSIVEGVLCDHLAFRQLDTDWQLWVEKGARAVPRKIVITTRHEVGDPQFSAVMTWNVNPKFDKDSFAFDPPAGANKISFTQPEVFLAGEK